MALHPQDQGSKTNGHPQADDAKAGAPKGAIAWAVGMTQLLSWSLKLSVFAVGWKWKSMTEFAMKRIKRSAVVGINHNAVALT